MSDTPEPTTPAPKRHRHAKKAAVKPSAQGPTAPTHTPMQARLEELKAQFTNGQKTLGDLRNKSTELEAILLRISGAIQVLEELIAAEQQPAPDGGNQ